ncbi:MAG: hypothetical protein KAI02_05045 [Gammaproteobacteria bacterium]|nr:hypothetical protein [Gammaproteobacteria bacterium]
MDYHHLSYPNNNRVKNTFNRKLRLLRQLFVKKKTGFRQDPLVTLTYFVLIGVLISGIASFGF